MLVMQKNKNKERKEIYVPGTRDERGSEIFQIPKSCDHVDNFMSTLTSLFVSNHHDHAKLLSPKFGKQLEHVVSNFGPEVFFFVACLFFLLTYIYIYSPPPQTTNNAWSQWRRAQTTHIKYVFFVCLFFLLSHRHSCHHHDHGRHVRTEGKMTSSGPKQIILSFIHFMIQISNQLV